MRGRLLLAFVVRLSGNRLHMCLSKVRCCHPLVLDGLNGSTKQQIHALQLRMVSCMVL